MQKKIIRRTVTAARFTFMKQNSSLNYKIAMTGIFSALSILLSFTPLGYIQLGTAINITLMHIPVILVTVIAGLVPGIAVGLVFGLSSLIKTVMSGAAAGPFFLNPLVSVVPRMLFPVAVWAVFSLLNAIPRFPKIISASVAAAAGTFIHTVLVMGAIFLLYQDIFMGMIRGAIEKLGFTSGSISGGKAFLAVIATTMITNGFLEILAAVILTAAVTGSIYAANSRKSKLSKLE